MLCNIALTLLAVYIIGFIVVFLWAFLQNDQKMGRYSWFSILPAIVWPWLVFGPIPGDQGTMFTRFVRRIWVRIRW